MEFGHAPAPKESPIFCLTLVGMEIALHFLWQGRATWTDEPDG